MGLPALIADNVLNSLAAGFIKAKRSINGLVADVTVEEQHNDRLTITQHPVEKTASITDHAYKEPPTVRIRACWTSSVLSNVLSNILSGNLSGAVSSLTGLGGAVTNTRPTSVYNQLLLWQEQCTLMTVYTGKRKYDDMLLAEVEVITNQDSEYALVTELTFQHIILVETTTVTVPPNNVQADPASTGSVTDQGAQNLQPAGRFDNLSTQDD